MAFESMIKKAKAKLSWGGPLPYRMLMLHRHIIQTNFNFIYSNLNYIYFYMLAKFQVNENYKENRVFFNIRFICVNKLNGLKNLCIEIFSLEFSKII